MTAQAELGELPFPQVPTINSRSDSCVRYRRTSATGRERLL